MKFTWTKKRFGQLRITSSTENWPMHMNSPWITSTIVNLKNQMHWLYDWFTHKTCRGKRFLHVFLFILSIKRLPPFGTGIHVILSCLGLLYLSAGVQPGLPPCFQKARGSGSDWALSAQFVCLRGSRLWGRPETQHSPWLDNNTALVYTVRTVPTPHAPCLFSQ